MSARPALPALLLAMLAGLPAVAGGGAPPAMGEKGAGSPAGVAAAGGAAAVAAPGTGVIVELRESPAGPGAGRGTLQLLTARAAALGVVSMRPLFAGHTDPADPLARFWIAGTGTDRSPQDVAAALRAEPLVASATLDAVVPLLDCVPDDHFFVHAAPDSAQWPLYANPYGPDLEALEAWNVTPGDTSVIIAVLDSGVHWQHQDFGPPLSPAGAIWTNWTEAAGFPGLDDDGNGFVDDLRGWDFVDVSTIPGEIGYVNPAEDGTVPDNEPDDFEGHGTFVAGIIGARADDGCGMAGAAPGCRIMPVRVGWRRDYERVEPPLIIHDGVTWTAFCAQAIVYAADNGARVINASWESNEIPAMKAAADYAINVKKVVMVVAAGNYGLTDYRERNYLARRGDCIDVAALYRTGVVSPATAIGSWVDISAPGQGILSLGVPRKHRLYEIWAPGATSFAAPFVSAAAGLALTRYSTDTPEMVRAWLMAGATPIYGIGANASYLGKLGAGMVNLAAAVGAGPVSKTWLPPVRLGQPAALAPAMLENACLFTDEVGRFCSVRDVAAGLEHGVEADSQALPIASPVAGFAAVVWQPAPEDTSLLRAVTFRSGHVALLDQEGWPRPVGGPLYGGPVVADLDVDGDPEIVVAGSDSLLYAWKPSGAAEPGFPVRLGEGSATAPAVGDLEGNGGTDIVTVTRDGVVEVFDGTGGRRAGWPSEPLAGAGTISPLLADVDADGNLEIVVPGNGGRIHCLEAAGQVKSGGWPVTLGAEMAGEPAAADLDGDGGAEILVALADGSVVVLDGAGQVRDGWPVMLPDEPIGGPLAIVADGGTLPAAVVATSSGCVFAFDGNGQDLPGWPKRHDGDLAQMPAGVGNNGYGQSLLWITATDGTVRSFTFPPATAGAAAAPWSCLGGNAARTRALPVTVQRPLPLTSGPPPRLLLSPNPWFGGVVRIWLSVERAGPGRVDILDVRGRLIRRVFEGNLRAGETPLAWDGLDETGRPVAAGLYACRAMTPGRLIAGRLVRLR